MSDTLRIASWNCAGALRKKRTLLDTLGADVYIVQECEDPQHADDDYRQWAGQYLWTGTSKHRGLGVFARNGHRLSKVINRARKPISYTCKNSNRSFSWLPKDPESFIPCRLNDKINLHAVWTKQQKPNTFSYVGQLWQYVRSNQRKLKKPATIICGDFNSNKIWDKKHGEWNHTSVVEDLAKLNISSLYHRQTGDAQGEESQATFYLYRHLDKPYHLDYVFLSEDLQHNATLYVAADQPWLTHSDHLPLIFTIQL